MDSPRRSRRTASRQHPYESTITRIERRVKQKKKESPPRFTKRLWRFINPFRKDTDDEAEDQDEEDEQEDNEDSEQGSSVPADEQLSMDQADSDAPVSTDDDISAQAEERDETNADETMHVHKSVLRSTSPSPELVVEEPRETETDNSQATLIASLPTDDSAIVADVYEELAPKKSIESDRSSQVDVVDTEDQPAKGGKRSKRLRAKMAEGPALAPTDTTPTVPLTTRITRRSTRSQALKQDESQEETSAPSTPAPTEPEETTENTQEEQEQEQKDEPAVVSRNTPEETEPPASLIEVVVESKKTRSTKKAKGKKGRKKSVVDKRVVEPELSDEDKDVTIESEPVTEEKEEPPLTAAEVEKEQHETTQRIEELEQRTETARQAIHDIGNTLADDSEDEEIDRYYAARLKDIEAREELENEEFYTSTQFDDLPEATADMEEDEDTVKYYPPEPEEEDENAESVKYYPPSEGDEMDPKAIYGLPDTDAESAVASTPATVGQGSEADEEDLSQVESAPSIIPSYLVAPEEGSPAPSFEFSPMQTPTDSPVATPGPSHLRTTGGDDEQEQGIEPVEHSTLETEAGAKDEDSDDPNLDTANKVSLHPSHNLDVLITFFRQRRGNMLTREQANICHRLIEDSVLGDGRKQRFSRGQKRAAEESTEEVSQDSATEERPRKTMTRRDKQVEVESEEDVKRHTPQLKPMAMKRLASNDLQPSMPRTKRVSTAVSKSDYLEIEKYKGVPWDKLPDHIKIRRQLEWKGTEPPEVVRQRELERRQKRLADEAAAKKRRQQLAQEEAERAARDAEEATAALKAKASTTTSGPKNPLLGKHGYSTALLLEDSDNDELANAGGDEEEEEGDQPLTRKNKAADAQEEEDDGNQKPAMSSVAQMMLNIVGKTPNSAEKDKPAAPPTTSAPQTSTTIKVDVTGSSPFSFAPVPDKTGSEEEQEEEEDRTITTMEKSAPLSLDAIRKEAATAKAVEATEASKPTTSLFAVPATGSLFAKPGVPLDSADKKKDASESFKPPSLFSTPPLFGTGSKSNPTTTLSTKETSSLVTSTTSPFSADSKAPGIFNFGVSTSPFGAKPTTSTSLFGTKSDDKEGAASSTTTASIPFGSLQSSSPFGAKVTPSFGFGSQSATSTTVAPITGAATNTTPANTNVFGTFGLTNTASTASRPFSSFGVKKDDGSSSDLKAASPTPGFGLFSQFAKAPAGASKDKDGGAGSTSASLVTSSLRDYDEEGEPSDQKQGSKASVEDDEEQDIRSYSEGDEDGQSYNEGSQGDYYEEDNDYGDNYSGNDGSGDETNNDRSEPESPSQDKENVAPVKPLFAVPGPFNFGIPSSISAGGTTTGGATTSGSAFSAFTSSSLSSSSTTTSMTTTTTTTTTSSNAFSFGGPFGAKPSVTSTTTAPITSTQSSLRIPEFDFMFEADNEDSQEATMGSSNSGSSLSFGFGASAPLIKQRSGISEYERSPERFAAAVQDTEEGVMSPMISPLASPVLSPAPSPTKTP